MTGTALYNARSGLEAGSTAAAGSGGFYWTNEVNGYHRFIKERNRSARGFGTKYLKRYNALFSRVYRGANYLSDDLYKTMRISGFKTISRHANRGPARLVAALQPCFRLSPIFYTPLASKDLRLTFRLYMTVWRPE
jgi:hypothetical protein